METSEKIELRIQKPTLNSPIEKEFNNLSIRPEFNSSQTLADIDDISEIDDDILEVKNDTDSSQTTKNGESLFCGDTEIVKRKPKDNIVLNMLLDDLHAKTENLAEGERTILFRNVLPKVDVMCLQGLKNKVSDADFLWYNYYFTLKQADKKFTHLKSCLVPEYKFDNMFVPETKQCLENEAYTERKHDFDIKVINETKPINKYLSLDMICNLELM